MWSRLLALVAYHPALIYVNTLKYLYGASPGSEPLGYTVCCGSALAGGLGMVAVIQHLLGLAMALTLYAVLLRRRAGRWLAALAVAPCCWMPIRSRWSRRSCPTCGSRR